VFGTDGIWETFSPGQEQFGTERLRQAIRGTAHRDAVGIKEAILDAVNQFRGAGPQSDDVTVVVKLAPLVARGVPAGAALAVGVGL
jgi:phosphoserine phosphatase RsbU/P